MLISRVQVEFSRGQWKSLCQVYFSVCKYITVSHLMQSMQTCHHMLCLWHDAERQSTAAAYWSSWAALQGGGCERTSPRWSPVAKLLFRPYHAKAQLCGQDLRWDSAWQLVRMHQCNGRNTPWKSDQERINPTQNTPSCDQRGLLCGQHECYVAKEDHYSIRGVSSLWTQKKEKEKKEHVIILHDCTTWQRLLNSQS